MKKNSLVLAYLAGISLCYSQIQFEKGYFITNDDTKTECLIRNAEWVNNPDSFKYKFDINEDAQETSIDNVKEFGVSGIKYVRFTVAIDQSSSDVRKLDDNRFPIWKTETVFLKQLIEGKADLYQLQTPHFERFFFAVDNGPVKQLVFKEYVAPTNRGGFTANKDFQLRFNGTYMNQLETEVSCGPKRVGTHKQLKFNKVNLIRYFTDYNSCSGGSSTVADEMKKKPDLNIRIRPGVDFGKLTINGFPNLLYPKENNFRLGIEGEVIFAFNKNKWGVIVEPVFQSFKSTKIKDAPVTYNSIELLFGGRHYFYLNNNLRLFANIGFLVDKPVQFDVVTKSYGTIKFKDARLNGFGGFGIAHRKFSVEGRYYSNRNGFDDSGFYRYLYSKTSIVFGYKII